MHVVIFGATGMIGRGVLLECLDSPDVESVRTVGRSRLDVKHPKLREIQHDDFLDFAPIADELDGLDACMWCLGRTAAGMSEEDYTKVTVGFVEAAAKVMLERNPEMVMCFVSGAGTDSTEKGGAMWARVKGRAENLLLDYGFREATMFRPAMIEPRRGVTSRTTLYRVMYAMMWPLFPVLNLIGPKWLTTTDMVGRAMIEVAKNGSERRILESEHIRAVAPA